LKLSLFLLMVIAALLPVGLAFYAIPLLPTGD
jgi:hypothetical protein